MRPALIGLLLVAATLFVLRPDDLLLDNADEVCPVFEQVRTERLLDSDNTRWFEALTGALADVMPRDYHDEMALFYYPYGGRVDGLNTDGINAARAGEALDELFHLNCEASTPLQEATLVSASPR